MIKVKSYIPNVLTSANLFCGILAILFVTAQFLPGAVFMIILCFFLDVLDGFTARILSSQSLLGKHLDSLADMVSFGVVPGLIMSLLLLRACDDVYQPEAFMKGEMSVWFLIALFIPVFSAVRLAKFNIDPRQEHFFHGLPTPSNTMLILSYWLIISEQPGTWLAKGLSNPWILTALTMFSCWLLISDMRLLSLKMTSLSLRKHIFHYLLLFIGLILLFFLQYTGIPFIILLYIILSQLHNRFQTI